ncbi:MAG TPA: bacillithiol biosynthesis cysteine-adding enzyme BshC [Chitinophagaceae bacterium]|nr:bacillithiol biosynthesis cysteine-adding enzyme BshC [Chitinophagaceae bacterium]
MKPNITHISYHDTHAFAPIVLDYIDQKQALQPFYTHPPNLEGITAAIEQRKKYATPRAVLVKALQQQYQQLAPDATVNHNIQQLLLPNTFTICTAHQPNIFTGRLYFIYKIAHAIQLAKALSQQLPAYQFVPVYYMGSEDGDIDELNNIVINNKEIVWETLQTGAVGRMHTDGIEKIIDQLKNIFQYEPFVDELITLCRKAYQHTTIQEASFYLVHELFKMYGLIVLIPDNKLLKDVFKPFIQQELTTQFSHKQLQQSIKKLSTHYNIQATGRDINLFYLDNNVRERIEKINNTYVVKKLNIVWKEEEIITLLNTYPERFSPNVILRPLFQEMILPNIAFIGGGAELAYWLELKNMFDTQQVPYPVLLLRNSFLLVEDKLYNKALDIVQQPTALFTPVQTQMLDYVKKHAIQALDLNKVLQQHHQIYQELIQKATAIDATLLQHVQALEAKSLKRLKILEHKMLSAEKKKHAIVEQQLAQIHHTILPNNTLQERIENILPYYAKWGSKCIDTIIQNSLTTEQQFTIIATT